MPGHSVRRALLLAAACAASTLYLSACQAGAETRGQDGKAEGAAASAEAGAPAQAANPVMTSLRQYMERYRSYLVGAARQMPADGYGFRPTDGVRTYGEEMAHVATSSAYLCQKIAGADPAGIEVAHDASKDAIVSALEEAFDYCKRVLDGTSDASLGERVQLFGGMEAPRAMGVVGLAGDWADHYGHVALYLRMNGMLPPSAQESSSE